MLTSLLFTVGKLRVFFHFSPFIVNPYYTFDYIETAQMAEW